MTKDEAIAAMKQGKKVTHARSFTAEEWMIINSDDRFEFEDGATCQQYSFWEGRLPHAFLDGWELFDQIIKGNNMPKQERTTLQNKIDASIENSIDSFTRAVETEGVFHYLPHDTMGDREEEALTFDVLMEGCADNEAFMLAMLNLYKTMKSLHISDLTVKPSNLTLFINSIDEVLKPSIELCAKREHGIDI